MANILCIETATEICSACIAVDGETLIVKESDEPYSHSSILTLMIEDCFSEAGMQLTALDAIAVSSGPGSYTGLRVGASVAKGLCFGLDLPLIQIDTLHSMAHSVSTIIDNQDFIFSSIDARRLEVYGAIFNGRFELVLDSEAIVLDDFSLHKYVTKGSTIYLCGNGAKKSSKFFNEFNINNLELFCSAKHLTKPSHKAFLKNDFANLAYFSPNYVKPPGVTKPKRKLY